jgi:molybdopterin synthase sulfur carrier subunit
MAITIQFFAAFADFAGTRRLQLEYRPGLRCADIWKELQMRYPRLAPVPPLFAKEDEYVPPETLLSDGETLMIFPPVSGG